MLVGDQRRTCTNDGRWNLPEFGYTECLREYTVFYFFRLSVGVCLSLQDVSELN